MPLDSDREVSVSVSYPTGVVEADPQIDSLIEFARSILHENERFVLRKEYQYNKLDVLTNGAFTGRIVFEFFDYEEVPVPDGDPAARFRNRIRSIEKLREFRITSIDDTHVSGRVT